MRQTRAALPLRTTTSTLPDSVETPVGRRRRGALSVVCTSPTVLRLFEITRLDSTFHIAHTREQALAFVGASRANATD